MLQCHVDCFLVLYSCLGHRWQWPTCLAVAERPAVEAVVDVFRLPSGTTEGKQHWGHVEEAGCLVWLHRPQSLYSLWLAKYLHKAEVEVPSLHALHVHGGLQAWLRRRCRRQGVVGATLPIRMAFCLYEASFRSQLVEAFQVEVWIIFLLNITST